METPQSPAYILNLVNNKTVLANNDVNNQVSPNGGMVEDSKSSGKQKQETR